MRAVILYHPNEEFAGLCQDFKRDFEAQHKDKQVELISLDTVEGSEMAKLYDIVRYPAILVIGPEGSLQKLWQDRPFPAFDQISAYLQ